MNIQVEHNILKKIRLFFRGWVVRIFYIFLLRIRFVSLFHPKELKYHHSDGVRFPHPTLYPLWERGIIQEGGRSLGHPFPLFFTYLQFFPRQRNITNQDRGFTVSDIGVEMH